MNKEEINNVSVEFCIIKEERILENKLIYNEKIKLLYIISFVSELANASINSK